MSPSIDPDPILISEASCASEETSQELMWRSGLAAVGSALAYFLTTGFQNISHSPSAWLISIQYADGHHCSTAYGVPPGYFKRNRGLATGFTFAWSSLGGVIWPIVFNQLLHMKGIPFPWTVRIAGFIMIPLSIVCILTVRPAIKSKTFPLSAASEQEKGHEDIKDESQKIKNWLFVAIFGFFDPFFYVSTAIFLGRILPGFVSDKFGRFNMLVISAFTSGVIAFCWTAAKSTAGLTIWTVAYRFASGAVLSLQLACATTLIEHNFAGCYYGLNFASASL
ncbi:MAG: hypothetical protein FE78DRAFT_536578 [Acidomyces sp. 'richmondensis']|nr:MAG: hypothetical protein FE78DRAFT_536578 [Acidomyces sp. 'richmondensis']